jgi:hypothetical protein
MARKAEDISKMAVGTNKMKIVFAGGSNAAKVAAQWKGPGINVESVAVPGRKMASNTVGKLIETITASDENTVFGIGNICFASVDEDMRSGPPFSGRDGKFHAHGTLEVVSGVLFDRIFTLLKDVVSACKGRKLVLILPMPRYWIPCCEKGRRLDSLESDAEKRHLLKDLGRLRSAISGMVARLHANGNVDVVNPLEGSGRGAAGHRAGHERPRTPVHGGVHHVGQGRGGQGEEGGQGGLTAEEAFQGVELHPTGEPEQPFF